MKKILLILALTITVTLVYGQTSIDELFEKYAGKDGFTTVTFNGGLLKLAALFGDKEAENSMPLSITSIRILSQENDSIMVENFYNAVMKDIDLKDYDEFMRVKDSDQDLRMLVRTDGNKFKEFLLVSGGKDNAIIQVKGNMTFDEAKKFSSDVKKDHGMNLASKNR